jgi:hypothetical protein
MPLDKPGASAVANSLLSFPKRFLYPGIPKAHWAPQNGVNTPKYKNLGISQALVADGNAVFFLSSQWPLVGRAGRK